MRRGKNRIAYQPKDLQAGKHVTVKVINPDVEEKEFDMTDSGKGVYYVDIIFLKVGVYFFRVYVDGDYVGSNKVRIERSSLIVPYETELEGF